MNNAGIMSTPFMLSRDGYELQFATNHLGHFLLTSLLLDKVKAAGKDKRNLKEGWKSRVVTLSSTAHGFAGKIDFGKLTSSEGYDPHSSYARSKLANLLYARSLSQRLKDENTISVAVHPGFVFTGIQQHVGWPVKMFLQAATRALSFIYCASSISCGAATPIHVATAKDILGGEYYHSLKVRPSTRISHDCKLAEELWQYSEKACREFL